MLPPAELMRWACCGCMAGLNGCRAVIGASGACDVGTDRICTGGGEAIRTWTGEGEATLELGPCPCATEPRFLDKLLKLCTIGVGDAVECCSTHACGSWP